MPDDVMFNDSGRFPAGAAITGPLSRISWGAVWAGVMAALGMEILLTLFGFFVGFRMYNWRAPNPWSGIPAWSALWFLVTVGWSMFFGSWCAARLSGSPLPGDGIMHGIATWGLATTATIAIATVVSWAVLRESINVLSTAAVAAAQVAPPVVMHVPPGQIPPALVNTGPTAQATARLISSISLRIWLGALVAFVTAILGGLLGRSRTVVVAPPEAVPVQPRRAA
jgi:hypothetical protein